MAKDEKYVRSIASASGFLFQLSVEHKIRQAFENRYHDPIALLLREYPWENSPDKGYVDILLSKRESPALFVIECKRVKDGAWVFILEKGRTAKISRFRCRGLRRLEEKAPVESAVFNRSAGPQSEMAEFCAIRGSGEREPLLERRCAILLSAADAVAVDGFQITQTHGTNWIYFIPMIVTNATLSVCEVDPGEVSSDGSTLNSTVKEVPFIRFHKPLTTSLSDGFTSKSLDDSIEDRSRSVFIINSEHVGSFLASFRGVS